jgi:hypothetical protein
MSAMTTGETPVMKTRSSPRPSAAALIALKTVLITPSPPTSSW